LKEQGNAILATVMNLTLTTMISLSVITLSFSAYHTLLIRDAAVKAASSSALAETPGQQKYLLKLLKQSLPMLSSYEVQEFGDDRFIGYRVRALVPGLGFISEFLPIEVQAVAAREVI
jgi:hypothetical protein